MRVGVIIPASEGVDRGTDGGVDDDFEERESGAGGVCGETDPGRCEEGVHEVVGVGTEADEEEEFGLGFDGSDGAFEGDWSGGEH